MSRLEEYYGVKLRRKFLLQGQTAEITDGETKIVLCEPLTYMNKSGECIRKLLNRFKVPQEQMIVIFDDIDLPPGKVRVRKNGGPGTHNGMRSIVKETGTDAFPRIRVGTGDRPAGQDLVNWVLGRPGPDEKPLMEAAFAEAAECAAEWAEAGIDAAMRKAGGKKG